MKQDLQLRKKAENKKFKGKRRLGQLLVVVVTLVTVRVMKKNITNIFLEAKGKEAEEREDFKAYCESLLKDIGGNSSEQVN